MVKETVSVLQKHAKFVGDCVHCLVCDGVCLCITFCLLLLLSFSLQSLAEELLLLGQVLFYEAILAHLLTDLQDNNVHKTALYSNLRTLKPTIKEQ